MIRATLSEIIRAVESVHGKLDHPKHKHHEAMRRRTIAVVCMRAFGHPQPSYMEITRKMGFYNQQTARNYAARPVEDEAIRAVAERLAFQAKVGELVTLRDLLRRLADDTTLTALDVEVRK